MSDWITLAAVIVALCIGVASLRETRRIQRIERKHRQLKEIIDWAVEIYLYLDMDITSREISHPNDMIRILFSMDSKIRLIRGKSLYITALSFGYSKILHEKVTDFAKCIIEQHTIIKAAINEYRAKLDEYKEAGIVNQLKFAEDLIDPIKRAEFLQGIDKMDSNRMLLTKLSDEVILEAVYILSRDK